MKKDTDTTGLDLLLMFAYGALLSADALCHSESFAREVKRYLMGETSLQESLVKEIPDKLKFAWPVLVEIGERFRRGPLNLEAVKEYVFIQHNKTSEFPCWVRTGTIISIDNESREILVKPLLDPIGEKKEIEVSFLKLPQEIKKDDEIAFHWGWFVAKK